MMRASITLENNRLHAQLPASKTDFFQQGVTITITAAKDNACALKLICRLFTKFPTLLHALLFDTDKGFDRVYVTNVLQDTLSKLGYKSKYLGHFFWQGVATWASKTGFSSNDIMTLERCKSDLYKLYIQSNSEKTWNASQKLQH